MKKVTPYPTVAQAIADLDNGGRFYNLLSKANDGNISTAELAKVAGVFNDRQQMVLFLKMSMANFNTLQAKEMIGSLSDNLQKIYYENNAQIIEFADFPEVAESSSVIIEGTPVFTNAKEQFNGFIMVPIHGGGMAMIPIIEQYEVYKIEEDEQQKVFVAHIKGKEKLPPKKVKLGGVIKSMSTDKKNGNNSGRFLEIQYYSERFNERF